MTGALPSTVTEEAAILAAIMTVDGGYDRAASRLRPEHFSEPLFGRIFEQMGELARSGQAVNIFTVARAMSCEPAFADLGGHGYWVHLANQPYILSALSFVDGLVAQAKRRLLVGALEQSRSAAVDVSVDLDSAIRIAESGIADAMPEDVTGRTMRLGDAYGEAIRRVEALRRGEIEAGLNVYGWSDFNDLTGGIQPGDYVLIGGRSGMGKTAVSLGVARRAAQAGRGVLYISREMTRPALMERVLADLMQDLGGRATMADIRVGNVGDEDLRILWRAKKEVDAWPLVVDDPEGLSANYIGPLIRRHRQAFERRGERLELVIIDYMGLIEPPEGKGNRQEEVSATSRIIKNLAKATGIPIIVLCQLSRALEQREDKRPMLSDLRDSGQLEADADTVIFVYRDEYYLKQAEPPQNDLARRDAWEANLEAARDRIELYTAKKRQGDLCRRKGFFFGARQAIRNSDYFQTGGGA